MAAYEAWKSARRNIGHAEAVRETDYLLKLFRSQWRSKMSPSPVDLWEVIRTLTAKKIPFVLTGAHALGGWTGRPRSTHDVDILVKGGRNRARAVKALRELYPDLEVHVVHGVTAFFVPGDNESVIDVTYPHRADTQETLATAIWVEERGLRYRVPRLEAMLANKYGAMVTPTRDVRKRAQDCVDFSWAVIHASDPGREPIDRDRLRALGEMVWPGGGGDEIMRLVETVEAGGVVELSQLARDH